MTIEETKQLKKSIEGDIYKAIKDFNELVGCEIEAIHIWSEEIPFGKSKLSRVEIKVNL